MKEIIENGKEYIVKGDYPFGRYEKIAKSALGGEPQKLITLEDIMNKLIELENKINEK